MWTAVIRFWALVGVATTIIGFAGVPDDIAQWEQWIDSFMNDPLVTTLAEYAVQISQFINQAPIRVGLVILGVLIVIWPIRRFWKFRQSIKFRWRRLVADRVWISREDANELVRKSDWALSRRGKLSAPLIDFFSNKRILRDPEQIKFDRFVDIVLDKYYKRARDDVRTEDGAQLFDEGPLRAYMQRIFDDDVLSEFGNIPT
jgi:hypothetical protein